MRKIINCSITSALFFVLSFCSMASKAQTVFKDVAPIFIANCTSCHHTGGIEFPLGKYSEVLAHSSSVLTDVSSGRMPPWPPDANYKHYYHERILSASDKNLIVNWINNGMQAGDTTLAAVPPIYSNSQLHGTPDLILKLPIYTSTANLNDLYVCLNVPSNLVQDRYIKAFEFVPGNPAIIHHAVLTIDTTGTAVNDLSGTCYNFQGQINIGDYAPGMGPTVFPGIAPTKLGIRMKAGSSMSVQLHIPEGTQGQLDSSEIHVFFYPLNEPNVREMYFETVLQNWSFNIPANDSVTAIAKYPSTASGVPIDISLYSCFPHSHNTCTRITNFAYKATDTIPLVKIPNWDFHWQGQYTFTKMVKFPQGYRLCSKHLFDNTTNNPRTPNHNAPVVPGYFTTDEMLFDSFLYTYYQTGDETIDIAAILANDTLLNPTSIVNQEPLILKVKTYPNPMQTNTTIEYTLLQANFVELSIYNNLGEKVNKLVSQIESFGTHKHRWDATNENGVKLPKGSYFYKLQVGQQVAGGTLVLE